jgi:hypothetical protein
MQKLSKAQPRTIPISINISIIDEETTREELFAERGEVMEDKA